MFCFWPLHCWFLDPSNLAREDFRWSVGCLIVFARKVQWNLTAFHAAFPNNDCNSISTTSLQIVHKSPMTSMKPMDRMSRSVWILNLNSGSISRFVIRRRLIRAKVGLTLLVLSGLPCLDVFWLSMTRDSVTCVFLLFFLPFVSASFGVKSYNFRRWWTM